MLGQSVCPCCKKELNQNMLNLIYKIEQELKKEIFITSGMRCEKHNKIVGGSETSAHLKGLAIDIAFSSGNELYNLLDISKKFGVNRFGINFKKVFLHIDIDKTKPPKTIFGY